MRRAKATDTDSSDDFFGVAYFSCAKETAAAIKKNNSLFARGKRFSTEAVSPSHQPSAHQSLELTLELARGTYKKQSTTKIKIGPIDLAPN